MKKFYNKETKVDEDVESVSKFEVKKAGNGYVIEVQYKVDGWCRYETLIAQDTEHVLAIMNDWLG